MKATLDPCIGLLEFSSIAAGIEALDAMLKDSPVRPVLARPVSPGKYVILVTGDVDAVKSAVCAGTRGRRDVLVDELLLPHVHPGVFAALAGPVRVSPLDAVGVIETSSVAATVVAADIAVKKASVTLLDVRLANGIGGKGYVTMTGEVSDVQTAVAEGAAYAAERGKLTRSVVIPRPHPDLEAGLYSGG